MTKIDDRLQLHINTLSDAGIKPMAISRQLGLKYDTVKKNVAKRKLTGMLPPKDKLLKGKINGRWPLQIKKYLTQEPTATLEGIIAAVGLPVSVATLHRYLKRMDWSRKAAKRQILLSEANRQKRLEFCQDMLLKGPGVMFWGAMSRYAYGPLRVCYLCRNQQQSVIKSKKERLNRTLLQGARSVLHE
jgi:hypothetical protein